eukprot:TRINITY_DN4866_c0_g1_i2.p1 TRINITY_DN4866_c0_g1~~TRINITY_DN4866_c0_g1_i2.p1  ORF type:complete len:669 (+),score=84.12 TRINITY_DN4866_c0_g1_i2:72-2078(+)
MIDSIMSVISNGLLFIDNSFDPGCDAKEIQISWEGTDDPSITILDDGKGMNPKQFEDMFNQGFSTKRDLIDCPNPPIGRYGVGFKVGTMRIGSDVLVFSKTEHTRCIGLLSQNYHIEQNLQTIMTPIVCFNHTEDGTLESTNRRMVFNSREIENYTKVRMKKLKEYFDKIPKTGTLIIISKLRRIGDELELKFVNDNDIQIAPPMGSKPLKKQESSYEKMDYSLRAYCERLYVDKYVRIIIKDKLVERPKHPYFSAAICKHPFHPRGKAKGESGTITIGMTNVPNSFGTFIYYKNRLIKRNLRIGLHQNEIPEATNVGVIVHADFLVPLSHKQDFEESAAYTSLKQAIARRLSKYWEKFKGTAQRVLGQEIDNWVQCDACEKWRRIGKYALPSHSKSVKWYCYQNPDPNYNSCDIPAEPNQDEFVSIEDQASEVSRPDQDEDEERNPKKQKIELASKKTPSVNRQSTKETNSRAREDNMSVISGNTEVTGPQQTPRIKVETPQPRIPTHHCEVPSSNLFAEASLHHPMPTDDAEFDSNRSAIAPNSSQSFMNQTEYNHSVELPGTRWRTMDQIIAANTRTGPTNPGTTNVPTRVWSTFTPAERPLSDTPSKQPTPKLAFVEVARLFIAAGVKPELKSTVLHSSPEALQDIDWTLYAKDPDLCKLLRKT